jgi:hypothetical protein
MKVIVMELVFVPFIMIVIKQAAYVFVPPVAAKTGKLKIG